MSRVGLSHVSQRPLDALLLLPEWAAAALFVSHPLHGCCVQLRSLTDFAQNIPQRSNSPQTSSSRPVDQAGVAGRGKQADSQSGRRSEQRLSCPQPHSAQQTPVWRQSSWQWHASLFSAPKLSAGVAASRACHSSPAQRCSPAGCLQSSPSPSRAGVPAASGQYRNHSSEAAGHCWRCQAALQSGALFFCPGCGAIQPADPSLSFYTVMGLCAPGPLLLRPSFINAAGE